MMKEMLPRWQDALVWITVTRGMWLEDAVTRESTTVLSVTATTVPAVPLPLVHGIFL